MNINKDNRLSMILPNGICLIQNSMTTIAEEWAKDHWGIKNSRVFLSIDKNKYKTYLFVIGEKAEYENTSFESLIAHIDIYAMVNGYKTEELDLCKCSYPMPYYGNMSLCSSCNKIIKEKLF